MSSQRIGAMVRPLAEETVAQARPLLRILLLAVAVVLCIACANLAGLLLVRVIRRRREIAVRRALGASGAAVLRQSLVETLAVERCGRLDWTRLGGAGRTGWHQLLAGDAAACRIYPARLARGLVCGWARHC